MPELAQRGPFLLLFALNQQLGALLSQAMADAPLTPADFAVCSALRLMQPTTLTELAATLGMRPTTLSSTLTRLDQQGHLARQPNPADGRSRLISLTARGQQATQRLELGLPLVHLQVRCHACAVIPASGRLNTRHPPAGRPDAAPCPWCRDSGRC